MRSLACITGIIFCFAFSYAQEKQQPASICIIGTIHTGNNQFKHKTLFKQIKKENPDVILWEQNVKFKKTFGLITGYRLKLLKPAGIEQLALQKYSLKYKGAIGLPFDTTIANRRKYVKSMQATNQLIYSLLLAIKKSFKDSLDLEDYTRKHNDFYGFIDNGTLKQINKPNIVDKSKQLCKLDDEVLLPLAKKYISDTTLIKTFEKQLIFWQDRNNYMVERILKYVKEFPSKKIVILTGLLHKYILEDKLKESSNGSFTLVPMQAK